MGAGKAALFLSTAIAGGTMSCGAGAPTAPPSWAYAIDFHSKDAAVSVDMLEVGVFTEAPLDCLSLVFDRRTGLAPQPFASVAVPVCDVLGGAGGRIAMPDVDAALLVVAKKGDKDRFIGCAHRPAGASSDGATISLTNFDESVTVVPSACPTVAAYCAGMCK
jgi:hypothetical protein